MLTQLNTNTGFSRKIVFFLGVYVPRQHWAAMGCTENVQLIGSACTLRSLVGMISPPTGRGVLQSIGKNTIILEYPVYLSYAGIMF